MIDVNTLIKELRAHIGVDASDTDWDDPACLLVLNRSLWEILNKLEFKEKEGARTLTTVAGTDTYDLSLLTSFEAIQSVYVDNPTTLKRSKVTRSTPEFVGNGYNTNNYARAYPVQYYRRNEELVLYPIPDDIYTVTLLCLIRLQDLNNGNTPEIPQEWHEVILLGGVWRAYLKLGDGDRSNTTLNHQVRLMDSLVPVVNVEENDSKDSGVQVMTSRDPSIYGRRRLWK